MIMIKYRSGCFRPRSFMLIFRVYFTFEINLCWFCFANCKLSFYDICAVHCCFFPPPPAEGMGKYRSASTGVKTMMLAASTYSGSGGYDATGSSPPSGGQKGVRTPPPKLKRAPLRVLRRLGAEEVANPTNQNDCPSFWMSPLP